MRAEAAITLGGLLSHPAWAGTEVLAGSAGGITVGGVSMVTDLAAVVGARDQLVLCVVEPERRDWTLVAALRRMADAGARTLVLPGLAPLPHTTRELCARLGICVLGSPADVLSLAVHLEVLLTQPTVDRAQLVVRAHRELLDSHDQAAICGRVAAVLGHPVDLLDHDGTSLEQGTAAPDGFKSSPPIPQHWRSEEGEDAVACPVLSADGRQAELWLVASGVGGDTWWQQTSLDVLGIAAAELRRSRALRRLDLERDARLRATVLSDLLRLSGPPTPALRQRASDLGWRLDGWHTAFHFGLDGVDVLGSTPLLSAALEAEGLEAAVVERPAGWSVWLTTTVQPSVSAGRDVTAAARRVQRRLQHRLDLYVGVGRSYAGPSGIARSIGEAHDAARLASPRAASGRFLHVDGLGVAQMLLAWTQTDTFGPAARELLTPLEDQPGDLLATLAAYLDSESSIAATAAVMGIHRNTVASRVSRIERLLEVSLAQPDERLALHLACRTIGLGSSPPEAPSS